MARLATPDVTYNRRLRARQIAILAAFVLGVIAIVATSPVTSSIHVAPKSATVHLDADHSTALTRILVRINAEAATGSPNSRIDVHVDSVVATAAGAGPTSATEAVRFIVTSAPIGQLSPAPTLLTGDQPLPTAWQAEFSSTSPRELPLACPVGPCERAFWVIAQLRDQQTSAVDVHWSVEGDLGFYGDWPSGGGATIEIGDPILLTGETQLTAATPDEAVTLGPRHPAAARLLEVTVGASAIPTDGSALAFLSVELVGGNVPVTTAVYPVDGPTAAVPSPGASFPPAAPYGVDPFTGCVPGTSCTRHFLVTMAWTGDSPEEQSVDWRATVRRVDLTRAWSTPADLSARVQRRFDVADDEQPTTIHLAGDSIAAGRDLRPQVVLPMRTQSSAGEPLARLLPVPAVLTYRAHVGEPNPLPSDWRAGPSSEITLPIPGAVARTELFTNGTVEVIENATATDYANTYRVCHVSETCPPLTISTSVSRLDPAATAAPSVEIHWSVDVNVYSYADVPVSVSTDSE
jgi:hypothetical protein